MYWNANASNSYNNITGLTLTWDVLKFLLSSILWCWSKRLTLTWDVLKFHHWEDDAIQQCD